MNVDHPAPAVKNEAPPSRRALLRTYPALAATAPHRIKYRLRLLWADRHAPSRQRVEIIHIENPRRLLKLLGKIISTPDRPLLSLVVEARLKPHWTEVSPEFVAWKAEQLERRAAERAAASGGGHG